MVKAMLAVEAPMFRSRKPATAVIRRERPYVWKPVGKVAGAALLKA